RAHPRNGVRTICRSSFVVKNPLAALPVPSGGGTGVTAVHVEHARHLCDPHSVYL
ncbi:hypothetical protein C0J52_07690, partial [Blattella germanica]